MRLGRLLIFGRVADNLRRGKRPRQLFVTGFDLVEAFKHKILESLVARVWEVQMFAAGPLGNHQLAAVLFLKGHCLIQGDDGTFSLIIRWRLCCDAL